MLESDLFSVRCLDSSFSFFDLDRVFYNNILCSALPPMSPQHRTREDDPAMVSAFNICLFYCIPPSGREILTALTKLTSAPFTILVRSG